MNKKVLFSSLVATALMVGCTNEDFTEVNQGSGAVLDRPVVDLSFGIDNDAMTRMIGNETGIAFDASDMVGGVLLDYDKTNPSNWYEVAATGHVGNNKFTYDGQKFVTAGTTVVGSWLFYMQYDPWMTTHRDGVEFDFPEVQKEAKGYSEIVNHNFMISPVVNLDGEEEGYFNYNLPMSSVFSYAVIKMQFPKPVDVQKIVIKPTTSDLETSAPLSNRYVIDNQKVPVADVTAASLAANHTTPEAVLNNARIALTNATAYNYTALNGTGSGKFYSVLKPVTAGQMRADKTVKTLDIIALDCLEDPTSSTEFEAFMAIPAGKYSNIAVYAYTDNGVYKYDVQNDDIAAKKANESVAAVTQSDFYLLRNTRAFLHKVGAQWTSEQTGGKTPDGKLVVKDTDIKLNADLESADETSGTVVISQEDLIAVIKGITTDGEVKIRVLGDKVKIDQKVMEALEDKLVEKPDAYLSFANSDGAITVIGNESEAEPLKLHDITFNGGAVLESGFAEAGVDVNIPTGLTGQIAFTVKSGAYLTIANAGSTYAGIRTEANATIEVKSSGTVNVAAIRNDNYGNIVVNSPLNITTGFENNHNTLNGNKGVVTNNSVLTISATITDKCYNDGDIINNGTLNLTNVFTNNGTITNGNGENVAQLNVENTVTNTGTMNNADGSIILARGAQGQLTNKGTITNEGDMYCHQGQNKIFNTGKINAESGSTTYITTNSSIDESQAASGSTNDATMGEIVCAERNVDVSVTTNTQQGYISWTVPADMNKLVPAQGDKFNKVYLQGNCDLTEADAVNFVEVIGKATVTLDKKYQEFTFKAETEIYADPADYVKIAKLVVANGIRVKVPTENAIGVYAVTNTNSYTKTHLENNGTILVGGNFYTWIPSETDPSVKGEGIFASGDGENTAFQWNTTTWGN